MSTISSFKSDSVVFVLKDKRVSTAYQIRRIKLVHSHIHAMVNNVPISSLSDRVVLVHID